MKRLHKFEEMKRLSETLQFIKDRLLDLDDSGHQVSVNISSDSNRYNLIKVDISKDEMSKECIDMVEICDDYLGEIGYTLYQITISYVFKNNLIGSKHGVADLQMLSKLFNRPNLRFKEIKLVWKI
jgi:hypothetical protein